jgi:hypothetical protein
MEDGRSLLSFQKTIEIIQARTDGGLDQGDNHGHTHIFGRSS